MTESNGEITIHSAITLKKCGYCKTGKETYDGTTIGPRGICLDAYYAVYPYVLALLYDAKFPGIEHDDGIAIPCMEIENASVMKIRARPRRLRRIINLLERVLRYIGRPTDAIDKTVEIEVAKEGASCQMEKGQIFRFKVPDIGMLCPASFFSMYPLVRSLRKQKLTTFKTHSACPDPKTNVLYRIALGTTVSAPTVISEGTYRECPFFVDTTGFQFEAIGKGSCGKNGATTSRTELPTEITPKGICPTLYNIAIPYVMTFRGGGYFKWCQDIDRVGVQCPSVSGGLEFEVIRRNAAAGEATIRINRVRGLCPSGHRTGQEFDLDLKNSGCIHVFPRVLPLLLEAMSAASSNKNLPERGIVITCPVHSESKYLLRGFNQGLAE